MKRAVVVAALACVVASVTTAHAQDPPREPPPPVKWDPGWARAGLGTYTIIGAGAALTLAAAIAQPLPSHRYGGVLLDEGVRDTLRLRSLDGRLIARDVSDVFLSLAVSWPFFVDAAITTGWHRKSADASFEMLMIDSEAIAIIAAIQGVTNVFVSRERPYGRDCGGELPGQVIDCVGPSRFRSFFSGHAAISFTSASLICSHHMKLELLGGPGDVASCVAGYGIAAATATLRVVGDMHYATDVMTGAAVGTAVGLIVPALHYARRTRPGTNPGSVRFNLIPMASGLGVAGVF